MGLPNQNIPESAKNKAWMKACGSAIVSMTQNSRLSKAKDRFCYDMYNGNQNEADFDYLRKVGEYEYPAKVRFVPLLRPKLSILLSEETKRPFNWRVFTIDTESLDKKNDEKMRKYVMKMAENKKRISQSYRTALEQLDLFEQQIASAQQQSEESGKPMDPQMAMQLKMLQKELEIGRYMLSTDLLLSDQDVADIEKYFKYSFKDFLEVLCEKGVKYCMATQKLKFTFNRGFEDKLVVDKEYYFVDWEPESGKEDPVVRKVNPLNFYYAGDSEVQWTDEAEWCMEERYMSINQVIDEFGAELSQEDIEKIRKKVSYYNSQSGYGYGYYGTSYATTGSGNGTVDGCGPDELYAGTEDYGNMIRVCRTYWNSPRKVRVKMTPNKYIEGEFFRHVLKDDESINTSKGEKESVGYMNDVYQAVVIDQNIYVGCHKKHCTRSFDNYWKGQLPYIGMAHNWSTRKPYSLVWAGKDVQILWNLVHYHKELMLAISGSKGFIMDKSQVPEGMSEKEWMYQRKLGIGWVQTIRSGLGKQPTFNQFQSYDDSLSPSIQFIIQVLDHLENLAATVTGVSRQRQGQMVSTDQVGTAQQSMAQSSLITEIIHYEHEQTKQRVLTRMANLLKNAWAEGKKGQFMWGDIGQEMLNVPPDKLAEADYAVYAEDSGKEERAIAELKQLAYNQHAKGVLSMSQMVKMFNTDHLKELENLAIQYEEVAQQRAQASQESEQTHQMKLKELDGQLKMTLDKQAEDSQMMLAEIQRQRLEFDRYKFEADQEYKSRKDLMDDTTKNSAINTEEDIELQYLDETKRSNNMDFTLNKAKLVLEGVNMEQQNILKGDKEKIKD